MFTLFLSGAKIVNAQEVTKPIDPQVIMVEPTFQDITLEEASASAKTQIRVTNQTDSIQDFSVFAVDINQIDAQGNVVLSDKPLSGTSYSLADFLDLEPRSLSLVPKEQKIVDITIRNLQDLSPGGHYAAVVVKGVEPLEKIDNHQTILPALSSFLLVRKKGGERYHISLKSASDVHLLQLDFPKVISLLFENQGNVHTTPRGEIKITDLFRREVFEGTINEGSKVVLPESQREIETSIRQIRPSFPFMYYTVTVNGRSDPGNIPFQRSQVFVLLSIKVLLVLLFAIVGVVMLWLVRKRIFKIITKR